MTKFKHDILVRIVRTLDAIMITVPFMMCWFLYYAPRISSPYYSKGNFLVVALYFILYIVFARLYEGMRMSVYRVSEIVYGQFLAAGVSDAIIYVVIWLLSKHCRILCREWRHWQVRFLWPLYGLSLRRDGIFILFRRRKWLLSMTFERV